jgi:hypothetical protein
MVQKIHQMMHQSVGNEISFGIYLSFEGILFEGTTCTNG